ncbi:MAG TPA: lysophospholipid acyltransferase family protein [Cyclobacteriaceae bacterium]|nr:lysophospholipid acyltransferase family protein [Cyclobacteriaceae bacterium]
MFAFRLISRLPLSVLYLISDFLFLIICYVIQYRKRVIDGNLFYAFPEKSKAERDRIKRRFYRNFTDSFAETVKLLTISKEELDKRIKIENSHLVLDKIIQGEVVIGLTAHFFNWEASLLGIQSIVGHKSEVVYQKVNNPFFESLMQELRGRFGGKTVERKSFQRHFLRERNNPRLIILAADQRPEITENRYWTSFMNRQTAFYEGAEKLAKKFDLRVVTAFVTKPKRGHYTFSYEVLAEPPFDTIHHSITDRFVEQTERNIQQEPALYLWSHDRWKIKPPQPITDPTSNMA